MTLGQTFDQNVYPSMKHGAYHVADPQTVMPRPNSVCKACEPTRLASDNGGGHWFGFDQVLDGYGCLVDKRLEGAWRVVLRACERSRADVMLAKGFGEVLWPGIIPQNLSWLSLPQPRAFEGDDSRRPVETSYFRKSPRRVPLKQGECRSD